MILNHPSVQMIEVVAKALGDLKDEVVFVGGSTVPLYLNSKGSQEPRPTGDVDCVVEIANHKEYYEVENRLRQKGFVNSVRPEHPICRWSINGVMVDIMSSDERAVGFSNKWYQEGISESIIATLSQNLSIRNYLSRILLPRSMKPF